MSYQVLARKWRPKVFEELVGQPHVVKALTNALTSQRIHHAYLFTGTRGVGKTTISRILAKSLNCEQGVSAHPCGQCASCMEVDQGKFVDLIEVDAASRTKVEDTRDILDNVQYRPTRGRYKVYLIDEVHMLSNSSFNALLKTLEEPPSHVIFFLATTDPQKIPPTVLSRCLQFNLKSLTPELIAQQLQYVLEQESIVFEPAATKRIAVSAEGSMRDGLSLLDQAIAFGGGKVQHQDVLDMLGTIDGKFVVRILEALQANLPKAVIECVADIKQTSVNFKSILNEVIDALHHIAIYQVTGVSASELIDESAIKSFGESFTAQDIQLFYQFGLHGRRDFHLFPQAYQALEMTLLRMLAFKPKTPKMVKMETQASSDTSSLLVKPVKSVEAKAPLEPADKLNEPVLPMDEQPHVSASQAKVTMMTSVNACSLTEQQETALQTEGSHSPNHTTAWEGATATQKPAFNSAPKDDELPLPQPDIIKPESSFDSTADSVTTSKPEKNAAQDINDMISDFFNTDVSPSKNSVTEKQQEDKKAKAGVTTEFKTKREPDTSSGPDTKNTQPSVEQPIDLAPFPLVNESDRLPENEHELKNEVAQSSVVQSVFGMQDDLVGQPNEQAVDSSRVFTLESLTPNSWCELIGQLKISGPLQQVALHSCFEKYTGNEIAVSIDSTMGHFASQERLEKLAEAISECLGHPVTIGVIEANGTGETPKQRLDRIEKEQMESAIQSIEQDENVIAMKQQFEAKVALDKISPNKSLQ